jgi:hypothetical protein
VQAGALLFGGIAGGTANALTASLTPAITAYTNGLNIWVQSSATPNSGDATLAVNGLAATQILLNGAVLTAGQIAASTLYQFTFYNSKFYLFPASGFNGTITSTDAGATEGPDFIADRNSASPAASDVIGGFVMRGRDSAANIADYARLRGIILDPTNGSEDGQAVVSALIAGTETDILKIGPGVQIGAPAGGDQGAGTLNCAGLFVDGVAIPGVSRFYAEYTTNADLSTTIPNDDTPPTSSEGTQILSIGSVVVTGSQRVRQIFSGFGQASTSNARMTFSILRGTTCIQASANQEFGATTPGPTVMTVEEAPGAGTYTYSVRAGASSGVMRMNGTTAARLFGGVAKTNVIIDVLNP